MQAKSNGITINYTVEGPENAPWVVFSNSLITNLSMWDEQAAALKKEYRVLRYDQRGHGGTEVTEGPYNFDQLVDDVIGLYDVLGIKAAHFVGISMGGMTAVNLAERYPDRVNKLIPCDCGGFSTPAGAQQWSERVALAKDKGMDALADITLPRWFAPDFVATKNPVLDKVRGMINTTKLAGFAGGTGALSNYDLRPGYAKVKAPTQFICGAKDAALAGIKLLHEGVAGSTLIELEGAGHLSNLEKPHEFTAAVKKFLAT